MADVSRHVHVDRVDVRRHRKWPLGGDVAEGVEQEEEARSPGVDDPGLLEGWKLLRRVGKCDLGCGTSAFSG